jgi:hypothetical protein
MTVCLRVALVPVMFLIVILPNRFVSFSLTLLVSVCCGNDSVPPPVLCFAIVICSCLVCIISNISHELGIINQYSTDVYIFPSA